MRRDIDWAQPKYILEETPLPVPFGPPQIAHELAWVWTRDSAITSRRLTAWGMGRLATLSWLALLLPSWLGSNLTLGTVYFHWSLLVSVPSLCINTWKKLDYDPLHSRNLQRTSHSFVLISLSTKRMPNRQPFSKVTANFFKRTHLISISRRFGT